MDGALILFIVAVSFLTGWLFGRSKSVVTLPEEGPAWVTSTTTVTPAPDHRWSQWVDADENHDADLVRTCRTCGMVQGYWGAEDEDDDYEIEDVPECFQPVEGEPRDSGRTAGDSAA